MAPPVAPSISTLRWDTAVRLAYADDGEFEAVSFAHALHSPYWALRAVLGLHDETPGPTQAYRRYLIRASESRMWQRVERLLDWVWPKSLVLYGTRVATGRA